MLLNWWNNNWHNEWKADKVNNKDVQDVEVETLSETEKTTKQKKQLRTLSCCQSVN
jgi:hypothetical protein